MAHEVTRTSIELPPFESITITDTDGDNFLLERFYTSDGIVMRLLARHRSGHLVSVHISKRDFKALVDALCEAWKLIDDATCT